MSPNKNIILKVENLPKIGDKVINENLNSVGMVFDIFGSVLSPYISVKTTVEEPHRYVGHTLYAVPSKPPKEKRRKRK